MFEHFLFLPFNGLFFKSLVFFDFSCSLLKIVLFGNIALVKKLFILGQGVLINDFTTLVQISLLELVMRRADLSQKTVT